MARKIPFALADAKLERAMSFVVADLDWNQYEVKTASDAARFLGAAWSGTLTELEERELVPYSPDVVIRAGEERALVINDDLRDENEIVDDLLANIDRPKVSPKEVSGDLYLYALLSDTKAGRIAMVKKKNPTRRARGGKAIFGAGDELRALRADPWELDPVFDLVVGINGAYALNTWFFEQLFADAERLFAKIGPWVDDITTHLPMGDASRDILVDACENSTRLRRRLRAIAHRGHVARTSVKDVRRHVKEMGLAPRDFVDGQNLICTNENVAELLRILNEDLTRGGLTHDPFVIESKEPM